MRLVRLFLGRISQGSSDAGEGDVGLSMGLVLALLPLPGGFYAVFLFEKYSTLLQWMRGQHLLDPVAAAITDEYFFIVLSMAVTGVVAVLRWDSIFPDRRDYVNLVPLPLKTRNIFLANLVAILLLASVLAVDVNLVSALLFPLVVSASINAFTFFVQFIAVHAAVVVLASIFSFLSIFLTIGLLTVVLPYAAVRKVSLYLRAVIIGGLVAMLSTSFAVPSMLNELPGPVRWLPPVWFVGLCQLIRGRATPALAALGRLSLMASALTMVAALAVYAISYRRCFVRIPEITEISETSRGPRLAWIFRLLDRTVLSTPFQRGGYRFVMKTLFRSENHGVVLGGFFGLGIVTASQFLFASFSGSNPAKRALPTPEVLAIPLILSYCTILGVRIAFDIPTEIKANWMFRILLDKVKHECVTLALKIMLTFVLPWVLVIVLPVYAYLWGWRVALLETIVVAVWSLLLAEILLVGFRKVPFTCSYPPFRDSAVVLVLAYILGFFVFVVVTSHLEYWSLVVPFLTASFVVIALGSWYILSRFREEIAEIDKELIFEEGQRPAFEVLGLGSGFD